MPEKVAPEKLRKKIEEKTSIMPQGTAGAQSREGMRALAEKKASPPTTGMGELKKEIAGKQQTVAEARKNLEERGQKHAELAEKVGKSRWERTKEWFGNHWQATMAWGGATATLAGAATYLYAAGELIKTGMLDAVQSGVLNLSQAANQLATMMVIGANVMVIGFCVAAVGTGLWCVKQIEPYAGRALDRVSDWWAKRKEG